ncbi:MULTISPECIES: BsaWI family type II restriction enzyme [Fervidobacterium]|uniref:BsaWI restriction endonuclease type 2 domain-containing protein n=1 Tax=Fervidobacterium nodosum (strain ATCC 35602 / DSM 5306 / Rt17-B1) TaxID=381764 RepID=A7HKF6_FERNB|nr:MULTISPECIES: BsaWI family type II restriction enzyme [Fervidobacterium]ABS60389.1 hypothetical protein Fnod_0526 [Fervidobacterium nodosum Rt17-B1]KAF2960956.1 hypothetical protein AS161_03820 [Fervidobacterium sp. 2310opik-2]PHJ14592.1 hypothetical protein IM41_00050 [Fervidobacterium sp. SC_NGM5_G05]HOJ93888.1 BsaWI family type II restriction enzyme [Fervidobacterium nodosum]
MIKNRGFKCRKNIWEFIKQKYNDIVESRYGGSFLDALKNFEEISENHIRNGIKKFYEDERSRNQAWRSCKGALYEYAVFKYIENIIEKNENLKGKIEVKMGDEVIENYKKQIAIENWSDIIPDVDILLVDKKENSVIAILSCKTSLRERLTETAFWKRELEAKGKVGKIKLFFITTDKDEELKIETNRYIILHIIDYTFVTSTEKFEQLIKFYKEKYGKREDFDQLIQKIKPIGEMEKLLQSFLLQIT